MAGSDGGGRIFTNGELLSQQVDRASGGGDKHHPQTFEQARVLLTPQVDALKAAFGTIPERLRSRKLVIEAEVWANYLANSYFPSRLTNHLELTPLGSRIVQGTRDLPSSGKTEAVTKAFLMAVDEEHVGELLDLLNNGGTSKREMGAAEELRQFNRITVADAHVRKKAVKSSAELLPFEAVLHPDPDLTTTKSRRPASPDLLTKFAQLVESLGGEAHLDSNDTVDGLTFVAVDLPAEHVDEVARFNPLRSLTPTPRISMRESDNESYEMQSLASVEPVVRENLPRVLVFDGGVDPAAPLFAGVVDNFNLTGRAHTTSARNHGSAVTAAVLYGHLVGGQNLPAPAAQVSHFQVVPGPAEDSTEYPWILRQIRTSVESSNAMLVNLSLGPKVAVEDREPHRWTSVLDKLAHDRGVLFVTAAGNNGESDADTGLNRVQVPGDMVNGLCVGASDSAPGIASWNAAPYSGRGPGRSGARVQPGVLAFGGSDSSKFGRVRGNGEIHYDDVGTSYAAPLVTNGLARLIPELGANADAPTLRALSAHFATKSDVHEIGQVGHGVFPESPEQLLVCPPNEATVIYRGLLARDEVRSYQLPHPAAATTGTFDLFWTIAFTTATDSAEAGDYTNAGLEATFRPHALKHSLNFTDPITKTQSTKVKHLQTDSGEIASLQARGWRLSLNPASRSPKANSSNEAERRDQGKWESLWKAEDSIRASSLHFPRIDISHVTREGGRITSDTDDIDFTIVVTVRSRTGLPIYSQVENEFSVLTPLPLLVNANVGTVVEV
jgi:hypothetical protein